MNGNDFNWMLRQILDELRKYISSPAVIAFTLQKKRWLYPTAGFQVSIIDCLLLYGRGGFDSVKVKLPEIIKESQKYQEHILNNH